jgi:hypothetical protein
MNYSCALILVHLQKFSHTNHMYLKLTISIFLLTCIQIIEKYILLKINSKILFYKVKI